MFEWMKTNVRKMRAAREWSQAELAEEAGVRQATISKL